MANKLLLAKTSSNYATRTYASCTPMKCFWGLTLLLLLPCIPTFAEAHSPSSSKSAGGSSTEDLQKATQNPVASLISVPLQNNSSFNVQPDDPTQNVLNIQPVIPSGLSENWNLISRIITPIIYQPTVAQPVTQGGQPVNQGAFGFGDVNPT